MTTVTTPVRSTETNRGLRAFRAHLVNETRLIMREPAVLIFGAILPILTIIVMSAIPATREPVPEIGGLSVLQTYIPVITLFATSTLGLTVIPQILGSYREMGVLRRLRATPSSPSSLLAAMMVLIAGFGILVSVLLVLIPAVSGAGLPADLGWFGLAVLLSLSSFIALGTVLAAVVANPRIAAGIGNVFAVLMWFFAGMWYPRALFPDWLATIANLTPGGAAATAMTDATHGLAPNLLNFLILVAWTVAGAMLAARTFRWE